LFNKLDPIDYYVQYNTDDIVESHGIISFDEEKWRKRFLSVGEAWDMGGLYPPPRNPCGLHWTPLDSSQARLRPD